VKNSTNRQNGSALQVEPIPCTINPESPLPLLTGSGAPDACVDVNK
jgi:hypothetical protein